MFVIQIIFWFLGICLFFYLVFPFIMVLVSSFAKSKTINKTDKELDLACIITAYGGNFALTPPLIKSLLNQSHQEMMIYLVADDCTETSGIEHPQLIELHPEKKLSSKVKSFIHAIQHFQRPHDAIVIFDPDNIAEQNFLSTINQYLSAGYQAVQGKRTAKNLDTVYACADATGEIYKNYVERHAPYLIGSSPTIAGSGMAVNAELFKAYLQNERITGRLEDQKVIAAEDKILQNFIVRKKLQIAFADDAIIYDEKVSTGSQVQRQRSRWLYSYFENLPHALPFILKGISGLNINQLIFGFTTSSPPLFILLFSSLLLIPIAYFIDVRLSWMMFAGVMIFSGNILLSLALSGAPKEIWFALWAMPLFVLRQFLALFKMKLARKDFLVTHNQKKQTIEEIQKTIKVI